MRRVFLLCFLLLISAMACAGGTSPSPTVTKEKPNTLCEEFRGHLNKRARLSSFMIEGAKTADGTESIPHIDLDEDKVDDQVIKFCPGSGSIIPADLCKLQVTLSYSGKSFTFEEQRFYLIHYGPSFYVVASWMTNEKGPVHTDIYQLKSKGISRLCSYECGPKADCSSTANTSR